MVKTKNKIKKCRDRKFSRKLANAYVLRVRRGSVSGLLIPVAGSIVVKTQLPLKKTMINESIYKIVIVGINTVRSI